ncbi:hypothetical protein BU16DRAFT_587256 [Lophium mytilinum]|uniref:Uncharacterized protein n=1 Tax=Lophium mytilinum TaxID=390894 RepID=A0A6A6REJ7_9PEZI|nr:hypothetical protein BU16DRAFT_587256 [Lophium mytilinum]
MSLPQHLDPLDDGPPHRAYSTKILDENVKETLVEDSKRRLNDAHLDVEGRNYQEATEANAAASTRKAGRRVLLPLSMRPPPDWRTRPAMPVHSIPRASYYWPRPPQMAGTGYRSYLTVPDPDTLPWTSEFRPMYSVGDMPKDRGEPAQKKPRSVATTKPILDELREIFEAMQIPGSFEVTKRGDLPQVSPSPPAGLLECPGEIIDIIAQCLPRNSFLALRGTCNDMKEKTTYHFEQRHGQEKRLALDRSRAGLHSLVEIASQSSFAKRVRKVVVECGNLKAFIVCSLRNGPTRQCESICPDLYFHDAMLDLGMLVVSKYTVDFGLFIASLAALPELETIEITDEQPKDLLDRHPLFETGGAVPFMNNKRCHRCRQSATVGRCVHLTMLSKALQGLILDVVPNGPPLDTQVTNGPIPPVQRTLSLGQRLGAIPIVDDEDVDPLLPHPLHSLRRVQLRGNPVSLYNRKHKWSFWNYVFRSAPKLESITLNGDCDRFRNPNVYIDYGRWHPDLQSFATKQLTSLTLGYLCVDSISTSKLIDRYKSTLRKITLEGIMTNAPMRIVRALMQCESLDYLFVRAIFRLHAFIPHHIPIVFGDDESVLELRKFLIGFAPTDAQSFEKWRLTEHPKVPDPERNRDVVGWKFEGDAAGPGAAFLWDRARTWDV